MTTVALMAAGAHGLSLSAPALAEQAQQKEATSEHAVIPHAPTAASDGVPAPILAGGVVLAFAVGLSGGIAHRRRRVARRRSWPAAAATPVPKVSEPVQPAPPPPEPETPAPRVVAPPPEAERPKPPAPPPPEPETPAPRVVAAPPAPVAPPPEPPRRPAPARPAQPLRLVPHAQAPRPAPAADAPLAEAPELPRPQPEAVAETIMPPLTEAPEAVRVPPSAEAPEPDLPQAGPARRFARVAHWPDEAAELWTCELDWKAGYRKANFRAMVAAPGEGKRHPLGESTAVRWALMGEPEPPTPELAVRVRALVDSLEAAGWEHIGRGRRWYEQRFLWRGDGEPQPIVVTGLAAGDASD